LSSRLRTSIALDGPPVGGATVLAPAEIDAHTAPLLRARLAACDPAGRTIVDFAAVTLCGAAGIHALLEAQARHERHGGSLQVCRACPPVRRVFVVTHTAGLLDGYDTAADQESVISWSA
jgi:anti-anti-sigma factor